MKSIKIILITMEVACLASVIIMAFNPSWSSKECMAEFYSAYISMLSLLAVVLQREQQNIDWEDGLE